MSDAAYVPTPQTTATRAPQRVFYDREKVHSILDEAVVSHVGFLADGRPVVLPQLHARVGETLYLHGSSGARALLFARGSGLTVCVTVTLLDGLVLARSAFHHSVNYRSVVVHGTAVVVEDEQEKAAALEALVEAIAAGRSGGTRPPSRKELAATTVLRLPLREVSAKVRVGPPVDEPEDLDLPHWAGVLPLAVHPGAPLPAADIPPWTPVPQHVATWARPAPRVGVVISPSGAGSQRQLPCRVGHDYMITSDRGGSTSVIVEYTRYRIAQERRTGFEGAYAGAAEVLSQSSHCLDYELTRSVDDPARYILRTTWTSADGHLQWFRDGELFPTFFAAIKAYVGDIEEMRLYERIAVRGRGASVPSLYEWAGGTQAFDRLTEVFYGMVVRDELVGPLFAHMDPAHPRHVAMWLSEVFGGPDGYTRERGGYAHMLGRHVGRGITEAQRRRWVSLLLDAADQAGLPEDPEFRAAFVGYIEWGTRLAARNSRPGAQPVQDAPVPRWGWGVAPPYEG